MFVKIKGFLVLEGCVVVEEKHLKGNIVPVRIKIRNALYGRFSLGKVQHLRVKHLAALSVQFCKGPDRMGAARCKE